MALASLAGGFGIKSVQSTLSQLAGVEALMRLMPSKALLGSKPHKPYARHLSRSETVAALASLAIPNPLMASVGKGGGASPSEYAGV